VENGNLGVEIVNLGGLTCQQCAGLKGAEKTWESGYA